jgi:PAS domain S-box-containing protein
MIKYIILILLFLLCILCILILVNRKKINRDSVEGIELLLKYKTIFDNALTGIRLYDNNGYLIEANELSCSIYGISKDELFKANTCIFDNPVFSNIIDREHPEAFSGVLENDYDKLINDSYFTMGLPKGIHYTETHINPVYDYDDKLKFIVVTFRDVTETVNAHKQVEVEKDKAQASDRLKSDFLSNISHEIRTPLNAIVGFSDVICKFNPENQEMKKCQDMINHNSKILLNIINNILELSTIESGNMELDDKKFNLSEMFNTVYSSLKLQNPNPAEIIFTCEVPVDECNIIADKNQLRQLLIHLVHNSFKYTQKGCIRMSYEINPDGITVIVSDTGVGIPEEKIKRIYNRFDKLDSFKPGTGLGLSICKALVDNIGGKIDVSSVVGKGTTFRIWCPIESD